MTPVCEQCDDSNEPVAYCHTCSDYLCEECLRAHKRLKAYRDHKTVNITPGKALDIEPQAKKSYSCSIHPEKLLELYCKSCKSLACLLCFVGLHNGHDIGSIDDKTRQEVEQTINDLVEETDSKLAEFEDNLKYVSAVEKEKTKAPIPLKDQVDKKVDFLIQQLEARRKALHKEIDDACTKDLKQLWAQKDYHETAITSMEGALSFARRALACKEDTELLALCAQVTSRLKELSQLKWDSQAIEKIEMTTVEFNEQTNAQPLVVSEGETDTEWEMNSQDTDTTHAKKDTTVGEIHVHTSTPDIQIITTELQNRVPFSGGCSITFQVTAVNFKRKTPKLTASATSAQYYETYDCTTKANTTSSGWTVKFTPEEPDTYTITFQVNGNYGGIDIHKTSEYRIEVYTEPLEDDDDDDLNWLS